MCRKQKTLDFRRGFLLKFYLRAFRALRAGRFAALRAGLRALRAAGRFAALRAFFLLA